MSKPKIIVVMPAYNAEKTLKKTYDALPKDYVDEVILVDDCSKDNTVEVAKKLGITVIQHKKNTGYGGNQKTCYSNALKKGADVVVMVHPDFQYDPSLAPQMARPILEGEADIVNGSRMLAKGWAKKGGMPWWKRMGNRALTFYMNIMLGLNLTDSATGYIAYSRKALETIPFMKNHDGFEFDEEAIIQGVAKGLRRVEIPIPTRYFEDMSSISFRRACSYGWGLFKKVIMYKLHQIGIKKYSLVE